MPSLFYPFAAYGCSFLPFIPHPVCPFDSHPVPIIISVCLPSCQPCTPTPPQTETNSSADYLQPCTGNSVRFNFALAILRELCYTEKENKTEIRHFAQWIPLFSQCLRARQPLMHFRPHQGVYSETISGSPDLTLISSAKGDLPCFSPSGERFRPCLQSASQLRSSVSCPFQPQQQISILPPA